MANTAARPGSAAPSPDVPWPRPRGRVGATLWLGLALSACGGGGGDAETAAPTPAPPPAPAPAPAPAQLQCGLPDFQAELLRLINEHRARGAVCGTTVHTAVPALVWNDLLAQAAARHSQDMVDKSFFSHSGSDGSSGGQRISATGYAWRSWGENIAYGYTSSAAVVDAWIKSEGHCRNLMNPVFTGTGLACVRQSDSNAGSSIRWAWTQTLGSR